MKKINTLVIFVLIASLALSACAGTQATSVPEKTQAVVEAPTNTIEAPTNTPEAKSTDTAEAVPTDTGAVKTTDTPVPTQAAAPPTVLLPDMGGKTITVAVENAYPPFNSIDEATKQGVGWDYDAVTEICKRINCKPEFKEAAWDGIFAAMAAGEFDMLADGVTYTADRDKTVDFSVPYVNVIQMLLVRSDENASIDEIKADPKRLVGTQIGTTNEIVAKKNFAADKVKSFDTFPAAVLALLSGDIDGVVIDNISALGFMKENEGKLKIAGQLQSNEQLAFVFPPSSDLIWSINAAILSMKSDGTLDQINMKWGLLQEGQKTQAILPDMGGKTITVAVENAYPPFNSIDEATKQGVGWDYDAVTEICKRINCKPEFKEAAWDGIFAAMAAGEFDMLADGVTYTADRDKTVDFSVPYVNVIQMLLVRSDENASIDEIKADPKRLVGTQIGTTNEIVAKKNFAADKVKSFDTFPAAVLALLSGDIDGVVIDNISALGFMKENEGKLKIAGQLQSNEQLAFVFPPSSDLIWSINAAIESMIADGTLEQINRKWGLVQ